MHRKEQTCWFFKKFSFLPPSCLMKLQRRILFFCCCFFCQSKVIIERTNWTLFMSWRRMTFHIRRAHVSKVWLHSASLFSAIFHLQWIGCISARFDKPLQWCHAAHYYQCIWRITFHCRYIKAVRHLSKKKIKVLSWVLKMAYIWFPIDVEKPLLFCLCWFILTKGCNY